MKQMLMWIMAGFVITCFMIVTSCTYSVDDCKEAAKLHDIDIDRVSYNEDLDLCCYTVGNTGEMCRSLEVVKKEGFKPKFE